MAVADFHRLGLGEPHPIAAAHDQGVVSLLEAALAGLSPTLPTDRSSTASGWRSSGVPTWARAL